MAINCNKQIYRLKTNTFVLGLSSFVARRTILLISQSTAVVPLSKTLTSKGSRDVKLYYILENRSVTFSTFSLIRLGDYTQFEKYLYAGHDSFCSCKMSGVQMPDTNTE